MRGCKAIIVADDGVTALVGIAVLRILVIAAAVAIGTAAATHYRQQQRW